MIFTLTFLAVVQCRHFVVLFLYVSKCINHFNFFVRFLHFDIFQSFATFVELMLFFKLESSFIVLSFEISDTVRVISEITSTKSSSSVVDFIILPSIQIELLIDLFNFNDFCIKLSFFFSTFFIIVIVVGGCFNQNNISFWSINLPFLNTFVNQDGISLCFNYLTFVTTNFGLKVFEFAVFLLAILFIHFFIFNFFFTVIFDPVV